MRRRERLMKEPDVEQEPIAGIARNENLHAGIDRLSDSSRAVSDLVNTLNNALTDLNRRPIYLQITAGARGKLEIRQVEFLDVEDLARLAKVEARTVQGWIQRGISPTAYRPPGSRCILFEMSEAIAWIKQTAIGIARHR
jgi:hypothetical protein